MKIKAEKIYENLRILTMYIGGDKIWKVFLILIAFSRKRDRISQQY